MFSAAGDLSYNSGTGQFSIDVEDVYTKENFDSDYFFAKDSANSAVERNQHDTTTKNFAVTVASKTGNHVYSGGSGNAYYIDGTESPIVNLKLGRTYRFTLSSSDMSNHPFRFYYDAAKAVQYTTGVTTTATYAEIAITESTPPVLHYQCSAHGYMGHALQIGTRNFTGFTTTNLTEGTNLYYTDTRFDNRLATKTTDNLSEGSSNLYYTDARVQAVSLDSAEAQAMIDSNFTSGTITFGNNITAPRLRLTANNDVSLSSTNHGLQVGLTSGSNLAIDGNEILARNNGGSNQLNLNTNGGVVRIGDQAAGTKLSVRGPILAEDSATINGDVTFDSTGAILFDQSDQSLKFGDNYRAKFGTGNDLNIYHQNGNSVIRENNAGPIYIQTNNASTGIALTKNGATETMAKFIADGAVELYHNNVKTFETTATGAKINGNTGDAVLLLEADTTNTDEDDNPRIEYSQDGGGITASHGTDNSNSFFITTTSSLGSTRFDMLGGNRTRLYFGSNTKLETNDSGVDITGHLTTDSATIEAGILSVKNTGTQSQVRLYCEDANQHYAAIQAPAHATFAGNVVLTLPSATGTLISTSNSNAPTTTTSASDADFVLVDDGGTMKKITPANLGISSGITIQDSGGSLSTLATTLNFVGAGVVASGSGSTKTITISGGGSGSGAVAGGDTMVQFNDGGAFGADAEFTFAKSTNTLTIGGPLIATSKSFDIKHPTKKDKRLRYGSLEGPENGVYVRGRANSSKINLPDYWTGLVDEETITVELTPIGKHQKLYVKDIADNVVTIGNDNVVKKEINCFYTIYGERKDIDKLTVEY
tara:strand:- start:41 stop:2503 length:2463 start_codon:yes stop_codon:yes gene_type:complete